MDIILEILSNFITITGNSVIDGIILAIIGLISFFVAFGVVGVIFDAIGLYDSDIMSGVHWIVRIIVFLMLSAVCIAVAKLVVLLLSFYWWVYVIVFVIILSIVISVYIIKHKYSKKVAFIYSSKNCIASPSLEEHTDITKNECCPRCGGLLIKRHGPYGDFYGCENYPSINCRYTRKFK